MTKVYFVRHAEPNYKNHDDRTRELTSKGLKDRQLVSHFLDDKNIDLIASSPFKRAYDTVAEFASHKGISIQVIEDFRERRIDDVWIEDFNAFAKKQWEDFHYKLSGGECLQEVQERNIAALEAMVSNNSGKNIVVGSHGTAISTIIQYYNNKFQYADFERVKKYMPWIVEFEFDDANKCIGITEHNLFERR